MGVELLVNKVFLYFNMIDGMILDDLKKCCLFLYNF